MACIESIKVVAIFYIFAIYFRYELQHAQKKLQQLNLKVPLQQKQRFAVPVSYQINMMWRVHAGSNAPHVIGGTTKHVSR